MTPGRLPPLVPALALLAAAAAGGALLLETRQATALTAAPTAVAPKQAGGAASPAGPRSPAAEPTCELDSEAAEIADRALVEDARAALQRNSGVLAGQLGQPRVGQQALRLALPLAPGALTPITDIGTQVAAHGLPMNLAYFETTLDPPTVLEFYAQHFRSRGLPFVGVAESLRLIGHPALSATDLPERRQLTVMALEEAGRTTVILGVADMIPENRVRDDLGDLPVYPGSAPLAVQATDLELRSLTVSFDTADPEEQVATFYRERLRQAGYAEAPDDSAAPGSAPRLLSFTAPGRRWNLTLSRQGPKTIATAVQTIQEALP